MKRLIHLIHTYNYHLLAGFVFLYVLLMAKNGVWIGDFWEHAAVVREFMARPWEPMNPMYLSDAAHHTLSPYILFVALVGNLLHLSPPVIFGIFGVINTIVFLVVFYFFIKEFFKPQSSWTATCALLSLFFLWGLTPWQWSNFFHFHVFHYVTPYASMFAFILFLLSLILLNRLRKNTNMLHIFLLTLFTALIALIHPLTLIALYLAYASFFIASKADIRLFFIIAGVSACTLLAIFLWPFYSLFEIVGSNAGQFHDTHGEAFYTSALSSLWPLLFTLPLFAKRLKTNGRTSRLSWFILLTGAMYILAFLFGMYGYGRIISFTAFGLQILFGAWVADMLREKSRVRTTIVSLSLFWITFSFFANGHHVRPFLADTILGHRVAFVKEHVGELDVVLTHSHLGWYVPVHAGRIIAPPENYVAFFIEDHEARRSAIDAFFAEETTDKERTIILNTYNPAFILLDTAVTPAESASTEWIKKQGDIAFVDDRFILIKR